MNGVVNMTNKVKVVRVGENSGRGVRGVSGRGRGYGRGRGRLRKLTFPKINWNC